MEFNWHSTNYRQIINDCIGKGQIRRPRGSLSALASHIGCHPTFISQVLNETAHLSADQAFSACKHFGFKADEIEYFLLMLQRDRSVTAKLREYFQQQLILKLEKKLEISEQRNSLGPFDKEYFSNWKLQAVHGATSLSGPKTADAIAKKLSLSQDEVLRILEKLREQKLVTPHGSQWTTTQESLHLSRSSPFIKDLHLTWRHKILSDLFEKDPTEGTHFSGAVMVSEKDYQKIREVLVKAIKQVQKISEPSIAENCYVLSIDCYRM